MIVLPWNPQEFVKTQKHKNAKVYNKFQFISTIILLMG